MVKFLRFMLFVAIVVIGYSMWKFQMSHEKKIISYGHVKALSETGLTSVEGRTRLIEQGHVKYKEVELPSGLWITCDGDCEKRLRLQVLDIHQDGFEE